MNGFSKVFFVSLSCVVLVACSNTEKTYAPVVNAWDQPTNKQGGYKVQKGDTLYSIAWAYGMDYQDLAKINHLSEPYTVSKGEILYLVPTERLDKQAKNMPIHAVKSQKKLSKPAESQIVKGWQWPTKGNVISVYSTANPVNKGIDISGSKGQEIDAANSGKVVYSGNGIPGYGNLIIVKHSNDYLSAYAHNNNNLVHEGQFVKAGQKIATMGLGNNSKPELHFEIRYRGKPINPLSKLPKVG